MLHSDHHLVARPLRIRQQSLPFLGQCLRIPRSNQGANSLFTQQREDLSPAGGDGRNPPSKALQHMSACSPPVADQHQHIKSSINRIDICRRSGKSQVPLEIHRLAD